ncbi:hypothetical protein AVEN_21418-1 [Araneus ventricosus]|uniref:Uncharacterized protein n=1 Tax=Araneus ventricosus TaxID=182803 RepID=A0A4Y2KUP3_ARAVE|nr:hypothetical protein AVEN_272793-1 [Araneus ventricosus]GBN64405.1 hypothetical protein AVEN_21418-1 [Araneus ventricosus]
MKNNCLIDTSTGRKISVQMMASSEGKITLLAEDSPYKELLMEFPEITRVEEKAKVKHQVEHHIETIGPPVFSRARSLPLEKLIIAKREFQYENRSRHLQTIQKQLGITIAYSAEKEWRLETLRRLQKTECGYKV